MTDAQDAAAAPRRRLPWIFNAPTDLAVFLGSAVASALLLAAGGAWGLLESDAPEWTWVTTVLLIDVAHVYATGFRVYFVPEELSRRPWLYWGVPLAGFVLGTALYSESPVWFWRVLAYFAVFHFVRQQYGWVALYRARAGETDRVGYAVDSLAIYAATLHPLVHWHLGAPRAFHWFLPGDFVNLSSLRGLLGVSAFVHAAALGTYAARSLYLGFVRGAWSPGKDIVVATTAACWYVGIITFNSDYAFTVTNVIIHGVPYLALVAWTRGAARPGAMNAAAGSAAPRKRRGGSLLSMLAVVWLLAYLEELLWDRGVWHERAWLFGAGWSLEAHRSWYVPLLALPQWTHYVLDGFIWRRKSNPRFTLVPLNGEEEVSPAGAR